MSDQRIWSVFKVGLAAAFFWAAAHSVHVSPAIADGGADAIRELECFIEGSAFLDDAARQRLRAGLLAPVS